MSGVNNHSIIRDVFIFDAFDFQSVKADVCSTLIRCFDFVLLALCLLCCSQMFLSCFRIKCYVNGRALAVVSVRRHIDWPVPYACFRPKARNRPRTKGRPIENHGFRRGFFNFWLLSLDLLWVQLIEILVDWLDWLKITRDGWTDGWLFLFEWERRY